MIHLTLLNNIDKVLKRLDVIICQKGVVSSDIRLSKTMALLSVAKGDVREDVRRFNCI